MKVKHTGVPQFKFGSTNANTFYSNNWY